MPEETLRFIYRLKTGALLEASMMIGAVLAEAGEETIKKTEQIARKIGVAFQIQDDILDVTGTMEELGKPLHSDEKNEKTTFVTLHGLEEAKRTVEILTKQAIELLKAVSYTHLIWQNLFCIELIFAVSFIYTDTS